MKVKDTKNTIGITSLNYKLPINSLSLNDLSRQSLLSSSIQVLRDFGFDSIYKFENIDTFYSSQKECLLTALTQAGLKKDAIDSFFLYSGISAKPNTNSDILSQFVYPLSHLQYDLGLKEVLSLAISQQGCSGLLSTIYHAARLLQTSDKKASVVLAADMLPSSSKREIMYNIMSDAVSAVVLEKNSEYNKIICFHQEVQPYYWNTPEHEQELLAAYFPMAKKSIEHCLQKAQLDRKSIRWFVPHNVSLRSWEILASLLEISEENIWTHNIARIGHTISSDHIINLSDMLASESISKGDYLLLFTFGFGASWTSMILQH